MEINTKKQLRVVVCGTGFGTFYAEAVKHREPDFCLAGIVAHGSERSKKCAKHFQVPLYTSVEELPNDIDLACVAIRSGSLGGAGTEMSLALLRKGIHVILEQPVHHEELKKCFLEARKHKCCFITGDLYMNMPEVRRFLQICQFLREKGEPLEYISAGSSVQAFYPFVEIFRQLVPGGKVTIDQVSQQMGSFKLLTGSIGKVPFVLQFNNLMNPDDPDNHMQLLHKFSCYYASGRLDLADTRGPLIWYPRLNMPWSVLKEGGLPEQYPEHMYERSIQVLTPEERLKMPYYKFVEESWVEGIGKDLDLLKTLIENPGRYLAKAQQEQSNSMLWNQFTTKLGFAVLDKTITEATITCQQIREAGNLFEKGNQ